MDDYDPQIMREFMNDLQTLGKASKETSDKIAAQGSTTEKYMQGLSKATKEASATLLKGAKDMASGLIDGQRGFETLVPVIDAASQALGGLLGAIPLIGGALDKTTQLVAEGGKLMLRQIATQVKAFQDISDIGAGATDGMTGLQRQFLASGLTLEDYTARVRSSAQSLSRFRGSATQGAEEFAQIVGAITRRGLGDQLRMIGMSAADIGEFTEGYITRSTRLGLSQRLTQAQLSTATVEYAKELDLLSKATGLSRKAIMSQQDAAMSEAKFRSTLEGIQDEGVRTNLLNFQTSVSSISAGIGQGIRDMASGIIGDSADAQALLVQTGGAALDIVEQLKSGSIDEYEARRRLQVALRENSRQLLTDLGPAIGDASIATRNTAGVFDLMNADLTKTGFDLKRTQQGQISATDDLTKSAVLTQKELEQMSINMQRMFFAAMPKATDVIHKFTNVVNQGMQKMANTFGIALPKMENFGLAVNERKVSEVKSTMGRGSAGTYKLPEGFTAPGKDRKETMDLIKSMMRSGMKNPTEQDIKIASQYGVAIAKQFSRAGGTTLVKDLGIQAAPGTTVAGMRDVLAGIQQSTMTGPKTSYSSNLASLDTTTTAIATTETAQQAAIQTNQIDLLKQVVEQQALTNEHLSKGNRIGQQQVRASYS